MIGFLRYLFLEDFWLKLLSVVLATVTWLVITFAQTSGLPSLNRHLRQRTFRNLPVVIMSTAADARNIRVEPKEVHVTVEGDGKVLDKLEGKDIHVLVDLSGIEAARDLRKRIDVSTPAGVTYIRVEPPEVQVRFPSGT